MNKDYKALNIYKKSRLVAAREDVDRQKSIIKMAEQQLVLAKKFLVFCEKDYLQFKKENKNEI